MNVTDSTVIQVAAVRAMLDRANASLVEGGPVGAVVATLLADSALETLMKQCLADLGKGTTKERTVVDLTEEIANTVPGLKGHSGLIAARKLRTARNPVQHGGLIPDPAGVAVHLRDGTKFAEALVKEIYQRDLEAFSLTTLVRHDEIRGALDRALVEVKVGRVDDACIYAAAAFGVLFGRVGYWVRRTMDVSLIEEDIGPGTRDFAVEEVFGATHPCAIVPRTDMLHWPEIARLSLGFPFAEVVAIKWLQVRASVVLESRRARSELTGDTPQPELVTKVVDSIARHVWRLESLEPGLLEGQG